MSGFKQAYEPYMTAQLKGATGARANRIKKGLGYAEKLFLENIWWPSFGNFNYLHPEFEVSDFRDGTRFIDFAYLRSIMKVAIEVDPFGTHVRSVDKWRHSDNLNRQNDLIIDGWRSFDSVLTTFATIRGNARNGCSSLSGNGSPIWAKRD